MFVRFPQVYGTMLPTSLGAPHRRSGIRAGAAVAISAATLLVLVSLSMHGPRMVLLDDSALDQDAVVDTTGRYLSKEAILSSHIPAAGGDSDDEMAVLEAAAGMRKSSKRSSFAARRTSDNYVHDWDSSKPSEGQSARLNKLRTQQSKLDGLNHKFAKQMQVSPGGPGMNGQ
jgi:hypothetical protein